MDLTRRIRSLASPLLRELRRRKQLTWEGAYSTFEAAPASGPSFDGGVWLEKMEQTTREILQRSQSSSALGIVSGEYALLPLLLGLEAESNDVTTILDFGGGLGRDYVTTKVAAPRLQLAYHVVEVPALCERGRSLHSNDRAIHFHESLRQLEVAPDVVVCHSSLQFVEDWRALLRELCAYQARRMMLIHVPAGDITTFATVQRNVEGSKIPCWFFSTKDIVEELRRSGYVLVYRSVLERTYDMQNFPAEKRVEHPCSLLFSRERP